MGEFDIHHQKRTLEKTAKAIITWAHKEQTAFRWKL